MKEAQAWREIARRIVEGVWSRDGLCSEINLLQLYARASDTVCASMKNRLRKYLGENRWAYPAGYSEEPRALAALWLALEAEEEGA